MSLIEQFPDLAKRLQGQTARGPWIEKYRRHKDRKAISRCRSRGRCEFDNCPATSGLHVHHIKTRGSGGGGTDRNLILLCFQHHMDAHSGAISRKRLLEIVRARTN